MTDTLTRRTITTPKDQISANIIHEHWMRQASCVGRSELYDQAAVGQHGPERREAAALCNACPVRQACIDYAHRTKARGVYLAGKVY